jgi:UDP-glucose 4-epimerase
MSKLESNESKKVVVLGGAGFIGSHLCRALLGFGYEVRIFSRIEGSYHLISDIENNIEIVEGDISSPDEVFEAIADAEILFHLVHTTVPGSSMTNPDYDIMSNVVASVKWLSLLPKTNIRQLYYISSGGTVYGTPEQIPIDENHPTNPICSYGIAKLMIEKYVTMYSSMAGIQSYILRPSNVYGPGQRLDKGQGIIGVLANRILMNEAIEVFGKGTSQRDFLYVEDMIAAVITLLNYKGPHRVFNISSETGYSVNDIIRVLHLQLGNFQRVLLRPERGYDVATNVLSSARLLHETGWQPRFNLEGGIARTIDYLRSSNCAAIEMV